MMPVMHRVALGLHYDGSHYHGWQAQKGLSTVQSAVEKALTFVANQPVTVFCAGRTDAGVHASGQVIHFDTTSERSEYAWVSGGNSNLPSDISIMWAKPVPSTFHARYSATKRRYRYIIYNHSVRPGILRHQIGWHYQDLNEKQMQAAADYLVGEHDFSSFRGRGCQAKSPIRNIAHIDVTRMGSMVVIEVLANAFLLHMVRNIVGVLIAVGVGDQPPEWAEEVLLAKDRRRGGMTIAPYGLYLVEVNYPEEFSLPKTSLGPFFLKI